MSELKNKIDFAVVFSVNHANPNGDPLNGNRPRTAFDDIGEVSDVCLKRKIRNRLMDFGQSVFLQSDDKNLDGYKSLKDRAAANEELQKTLKTKEKSKVEFEKVACQSWIDVRSFGQVFAFKGDSLSAGVRGPVSLHPAFSVDPVIISELQITKSVNSTTGDKKSSDTMGTKNRVDFGVYTFCGSINCQLAEKTGFSEEDADLIKQSLITLFENDCSSARPDGSMEILKVIWWKHNCKTGQYSSAKVHRSLSVKAKINHPKSIDDYEIKIDELQGLKPEIYGE
ncbi:MAG: type I-C CRISPR-associated protein Cas7/Csd2 [Erysipelotrichaceae bacterium]